MKKIYQKKAVQTYLEKYKIKDLFDETYDFYLIQYEKGETIIHPMNDTKMFQFVIKGSVSIYTINFEGNQHFVSESDDFMILGDLEFVLGSKPTFFSEASSEVEVLALPFEGNREKLNQDNRFLHVLLDSLAGKLIRSSSNTFMNETTEEKLFYYLKYFCPNQELNHVSKAAKNIHCSRRQLQRVLKECCENGSLIKIGKGRYKKTSV